jgi:phage-related protein/predicted  nucleic acid-binding Zn-ribbon protein
MGDEIRDLSGKLGLDTTDFKTAITAANRELRVLESGFRASAAGLDDWAKDATGLETRIRSLTSQMDIQGAKVRALGAEYDRVAAEKGKTSRAAQDLALKLNQETERLNKMQTELRQSETGLKALQDGSKNAGKGVEDLDKKQAKAVASANRFKAALGGLASAAKNAANGMAGLANKVAASAKRIAIGVATIGTAIAVGLAGALASTIGPASDLAETANKINTVFGSAAGSINAFAASAARDLGQSKQSALDAAATFGVFGKAAGLTDTQLGGFSTRLVGLSSDLASFYNTSPEEAIEAIGAALRGEAEPIRKYGVLMDDATLKQAAFEAGLIRSTKQALTPAQKTMAAYNLIMTQTKDAQGDFGKTSDGLANQQRILAATLENVRAKLGEGLLPLITVLMGRLTAGLGSDAVQKAVDGISKAIGSLAESLKALFSGNQDMATAGFLTMVYELGMAFGLSGEAAAGLGSTILGALGPVGDLIERVRGYATELFTIISTSGGDMGKLGEGIGGLIAKIIGDTANARAAMVTAALGIMQGLVTGLLAAIPTLLPVVIQLIRGIVQFIVTTAPMLVKAAAEILLTLVNGLIDLLPMLMETAIEIIVTLATGLAAALPELIPTIVDLVILLVETLIQNLPMILDAALKIILALAQGLIGAMPRLVTVIPRLILAIIGAIIRMLPMIFNAAVELVVMLANGVVSGAPKLHDAALDVVGGIGEAIANMAGEVLAWGKNIVDGVWEGIKGAYPIFRANVFNFFQGIVNDVKGLLGIHSPSTVFAGIGENMAAGLGVGFGRAFRDVARDINGFTATLGADPVLLPAGASAAGAASSAPLSVSVTLQLGSFNELLDLRLLANKLGPFLMDEIRLRR